MEEEKTVKLKVESNVDEVTASFEKTGKAINTTTKDVDNFNKSLKSTDKDFVKSQDKIQRSIKKTSDTAKRASGGGRKK